VLDFSLFARKARPLIGLDISTSSVKMVELSGDDKTGFCIERYAVEPLAREAVVDGNVANLEAVSDSVRRALRRMASNAKLVAMGLPASSVITKRITLPGGLREQEMEVQVEAEANQYIPFALEEVNLDFQVIGPAGDSDDVEVLIAASRKEKVEDRVAAAEAAGLKAQVVDVESFAAQAAFELVAKNIQGGMEGKIIALVDIGATSLDVTVLRDGHQIYAREQSFGGNLLTQDIARQYGMSFDEAEAAKRSASLPENYETELLRPFMDSLALEISRALQFFFTSTQYNQVDQIVLAGGCAVIAGLAEVVSGRTQVSCMVANPFAGMTLSQKIRPKNLMADAPSLLVACGLALRRFD